MEERSDLFCTKVRLSIQRAPKEPGEAGETRFWLAFSRLCHELSCQKVPLTLATFLLEAELTEKLPQIKSTSTSPTPKEENNVKEEDGDGEEERNWLQLGKGGGKDRGRKATFLSLKKLEQKNKHLFECPSRGSGRTDRQTDRKTNGPKIKSRKK